MKMQNLPLIIATDITFSADQKTVSIDPDLDIDGKCFDLYVDFIEEDSSNTYNLELKGFGFHNINIGKYFTLSSITSMKGNLYKNKGASNIVLRASDYTIDPISPDYYDGPLDFDEVFSIATGFGQLSNLGLDLYFDISNSDQLFDLQMFTADASFSISEDFQIGTGLLVELDKNLTFLMEFDYFF